MRADGDTDRRIGIDQDDPPAAGDAGARQPVRHFGGDLDAGEAGADHYDGRMPWRHRAASERDEVVLEVKRRGIGIDIEGMLGKSRNVGTHNLAAERQHQPIVGQRFRAAAGD